MFSVCVKSTAVFENSDESDLFALAAALPFGKTEAVRVLAISNRARRLQSLSGLTCLAVLIEKAAGNADDSEILRDENGRPFFTKIPAADFGISHSGALAAAAFCEENGRLGIDIEHVEEKKNTGKIAHRFFTETEQSDIFDPDGNICAEKFFLVWTKKEAAAKRDGRGLSAIAKRDIDTSALFFKSFRIESGGEKYILTLCAEKYGEIKFYYDEEIKIYEIQDRI